MENGKEIQRMRTLVIERLEGIYAICRDRDAKPRKNAKEQKFFAILLSELPESAAAGDTAAQTGEMIFRKAGAGREKPRGILPFGVCRKSPSPAGRRKAAAP